MAEKNEKKKREATESTCLVTLSLIGDMECSSQNRTHGNVRLASSEKKYELKRNRKRKAAPSPRLN